MCCRAERCTVRRKHGTEEDDCVSKRGDMEGHEIGNEFVICTECNKKEKKRQTGRRGHLRKKWDL